MKVDRCKLILAGMALLTGLAFTSCLGINNNGFPKRVLLPREGGEVVVEGNKHSWAPTFSDNEDSTWCSGDTVYQSYRWIIVGTPIENEGKWMLFKAASNTTNKKRSLMVFPEFGNEFGETKVIQF